MNTKEKLNMEIERRIHKHIDTIMESTIDSMFLYIRKNNLDIDRDSLSRTMEVLRKILPSEHLAKLDVFLNGLDKTLTEFIENEGQ